MTHQPGRTEVYEFGPFRLEAASHSLFRGEEFISLTPKAFELLRLLVEAEGRLVTKEEILSRVWPDAHIEDGSIANNISFLRKILNPYFEGDGPIATEARRGYRFTAPVAVVRFAEAATKEFPVAAKADHSKRIAIAAATILILAAIAIPAFMRSSDPAPVVRRSVAVLPMKNLSDDASQRWLSTALAETISAELAGGQQLRVVDGESIAMMQQESAALALSEHQPAQQADASRRVTRKQLNDMGRDLACDLILTGNYLVVDGRLRLDVRLDEVATGNTIASSSVTDSAARLLDIVSKAGSELRTALGIDQQTSGDATALRASFSVNPDALRNYFDGLDALRQRDGPKAREYLLASIKADGNFALAHSTLSTTWRLLGYDVRGAESAKRAFDLSSRLSAEDRIGVEAQHAEASASWPTAIALYRKLWTVYPDNIEYGLKLANAQWLGGRARDAVGTIEELRRMPERDSRDVRIDLIEATVVDVLGESARAREISDRAAEKAATPNLKLILARARIKQGIYAGRLSKQDEAQQFYVEAERLFAELGDAGGVADAVRWQGVVAIDRNRLDEARVLLRRAHDMAAPLNYVRLVALIESSQSLVARLQGDLQASAALAESSLASARESGDRTAQANALTNLGVARRMSGDYGRGRDAYREAAAIAAALGEVRIENTALNNMGVIEFLVGDLAAARKSFETVLASDRRIGNPGGTALRLNNLSRILQLQDELAAAEKMNAEECRFQEEIKSTVNLAWCRARLAGLWIDLGRRHDAEALVKQVAIADFRTGSLVPVYIARLARVQLALGDVASAAKAVAAAEAIQAKAGVVEELAIHVSVVRAEVEAAQGRHVAALERVKKARADADRLGLKTWSFDARLVLSRLDPTEAAATERDARAAGFTYIARKASER